MLEVLTLNEEPYGRTHREQQRGPIPLRRAFPPSLVSRMNIHKRAGPHLRVSSERLKELGEEDGDGRATPGGKEKVRMAPVETEVGTSRKWGRRFRRAFGRFEELRGTKTNAFKSNIAFEKVGLFIELRFLLCVLLPSIMFFSLPCRCWTGTEATGMQCHSAFLSSRKQGDTEVREQLDNPRAPFRRLVREILTSINSDLRIENEAIELLQCAGEDHIGQHFQSALSLAHQARRITVRKENFDLLASLQDALGGRSLQTVYHSY
ncbi:histone H3.Y like protein [Argiope bruennichi]|uniref:Histone H3.Y like protein n=1 Tax=Argiope bruennichi TaxID=94029 RepID=A0A8T0FS12_ARGBR|nr:histone H3.Y like protein [Argiope bruennichi]